MELAVCRVGSLRAFNWIKNGWRLFTQQPGPFMAMAGILMAIQVVASLIPLASYIAVFLLPFIVIGFYQVASRVEQGEQVSAGDIFHYLGRIGEYKVLFRIALLSIVLSIPASMAGGSMAENMVQGVPPSFQDMAVFVLFMGLNFMVTAFSIPAAWVSPQTPVSTLVLQSLQAVWQNAVPMTIYGIVIMAIFMLSMPIIVVGWLIALALSNLSFYLAFLDVFQPVSTASVEAGETPMDSSDGDQKGEDAATQNEPLSSEDREVSGHHDSATDEGSVRAPTKDDSSSTPVQQDDELDKK